MILCEKQLKPDKKILSGNFDEEYSKIAIRPQYFQDSEVFFEIIKGIKNDRDFFAALI